MNVTTPAPTSASPTSVRPLIVRIDATKNATMPRKTSSAPRLSQRLRATRGASAYQPWPITWRSSAALKLSTLSPKPRSALGRGSRRSRHGQEAQVVERGGLGRAQRPGVRDGRTRRVHVALDGQSDVAVHAHVVLAERDLATTCEVEERGRERPARGTVLENERATCRREIHRRPGHIDRRVVEVVRVTPVAEPREHRPAGEEQEEHGSATADDRVDLAGELELLARRGGGRGIHPRHRDERRPVQVALLQERQHVVLVDGLALAVREEGRHGSPGLHTAAPGRAPRVVEQIEEDHQAVVEALASDAPLVHERDRVLLGLAGVDARLDLRVDDDLGARALLDGVGRGLIRPWCPGAKTPAWS